MPIYLYGHILQPCRTSFINTSMLITLLMCYHRYRSISDPLAYHSDQLITNKGFWAIKATFVSLFLGWIANLPAFFEFQIIFNTHEYWKKYDNGTSYYVSNISFQICSLKLPLGSFFGHSIWSRSMMRNTFLMMIMMIRTFPHKYTSSKHLFLQPKHVWCLEWWSYYT